MPFAGFSTEIIFAILLALIATFVVALVNGLVSRTPPNAPPGPLSDSNVTAFLFDGPDLLDATPNARQLLDVVPNRNPGLSEVAAMLERQFPGIQTQISADHPLPHILAREPSRAIAAIDRTGDSLRITIRNDDAANTIIHPLALSAMQEELTALRHIGETAPQLIWKQDTSGTVTWANKAYLALADRVKAPIPGLTSDWPPVSLFPELTDHSANGAPETIRLCLRIPDEATEYWFDVTHSACEGGSILFATDATAILTAEKQGKLFVQTLSKTFAELSTGLAIFDRSRRLVMFNPALLDLTKLPATFLSGRPVFRAVLDRLRDQGLLPEPKDYSNWREQVIALEAEAAEGTYCDTWTLPTGETYRVTGRPHPDGALAFLIEDISAEIMLTRTFRSELETAHGVIDAMQEAIAVFSPTGQLIMSNTQYDEHWTNSPDAVAATTLLDQINDWQSIAAPTPLWNRLRKFGAPDQDRVALEEHIRTPDGRLVTCRVAPLIGGATLVGFRHQPADGPTPLDAEPVQNVGIG